MDFTVHSSLYSDTLLPDIFITEYMPLMKGEYMKVYVYVLFLGKHRKTASIEELSKILCLEYDIIKNALVYLEGAGLLYKNNDSIEVTDLKELEIRKLYRLKTTSSPGEALANNERNKHRNEIVTAINHTFFQGLMAPSWYTDIDAWFDRYKFDEDVMLALFHHCSAHNGLHRNYIAKVAQSWYNKNIKTSFDLDNYSIAYQKFKDVKGKVIKKLKLGRNLTEYEEEYVEKWVMEFKYEFDIIELALKRTVARTSPNFRYIDAIITDWYNSGLRDKESIDAYEKARRAAQQTKKAEGKAIPQSSNFEQRKYDDDELDRLYNNVRKGN